MAREEEESSEDELPVAREEEEESSEDTASDLSNSEEDGGHAEAAVEATPDANGTQRAIQVLLENLRCGRAPADNSAPTPVDSALDLLHDHAALSRARASLLSKSQDKSLLDVVFRARIDAMIGVLNLFLDQGLRYT